MSRTAILLGAQGTGVRIVSPKGTEVSYKPTPIAVLVPWVDSNGERWASTAVHISTKETK